MGCCSPLTRLSPASALWGQPRTSGSGHSTLAAPLEGPGQVGVGPWVLVPLARLPREGRRDPGAPSGWGLQPSRRPCLAGQRRGSKVRSGPALENVPSCGTGGGASSCAWLVCWRAGNGPAHQELAPLRLVPRTCPRSSLQGRWTCHFVQQRPPSPPQARARRLGAVWHARAGPSPPPGLSSRWTPPVPSVHCNVGPGGRARGCGLALPAAAGARAARPCTCAPGAQANLRVRMRLSPRGLALPKGPCPPCPQAASILASAAGPRSVEQGDLPWRSHGKTGLREPGPVRSCGHNLGAFFCLTRDQVGNPSLGQGNLVLF